ncbi:MAG: GNAT family N-acetyltransferase [Myxococcaceae bacterium]|nr:GNAT family N-acetyltransferase [Myxococcaceae bacterium]
MTLEVLHLTSDTLGAWVTRLSALERDISYPIDDGRDRFVLSHGAAYHPFFSQMGDAHFLLAVAGDELAGCIVGVRKRVDTPSGPVAGVYLADLKVAAPFRGQGVPARLLTAALALWARSPRRLSWRFAFGAAMRGDRGDVMRAAKGLTPMKLGAAVATLDVYFVEPQRLAALETAGAPTPMTGAGLDLSPAVTQDVVSTAGAKDFVLQSTHAPWPLVHLPAGPARWRGSHAEYLARGGRALVEAKAPGPACFALDVRRGAERDFLAGQGVRPGAVCTVYGFSTTRRTRGAAWVHLATSEI